MTDELKQAVERLRARATSVFCQHSPADINLLCDAVSPMECGHPRMCQSVCKWCAEGRDKIEMDYDAEDCLIVQPGSGRWMHLKFREGYQLEMVGYCCEPSYCSACRAQHDMVAAAEEATLKYLEPFIAFRERPHKGICTPESGCDASCQDAANLSEYLRSVKGNLARYVAAQVADVQATANALADERTILETQLTALRETSGDAEKWKRECELFQRAWIRELGGWLFPKAHLIDSLVLTTRARCVNPIMGNCRTPHYLGDPTTDKKALTQASHPQISECRDWSAKPPIESASEAAQVAELLTAQARIAELQSKLNYYDSVVTYTSMIALTDGDVVPAVKPLKQFLEEHEAKLKAVEIAGYSRAWKEAQSQMAQIAKQTAKLKDAESELAILRTQLEGLVAQWREHEKYEQVNEAASFSGYYADALAAVLNQPK